MKQHILVDFPAYTPLLEDGDVYPTLGGGHVTVTVVDGVVSLNGARILSGDAIITNGAVHTISKVSLFATSSRLSLILTGNSKVLGTPPAPRPSDVVTGAANSVAAPFLHWKAAAGAFFVAVVVAGQYLN